MDITYTYLKMRRDFGRQPLFCELPPRMVDSINPDPKEFKHYGLRNPVHEAVQHSKPQSEHDANTKRVKMVNRGVNHAEGGWPRDVNCEDEEQTARYRRRWEREDAYINAVMNISPMMEHYINQNNAIELYQTYFADMPPTPSIEKSRMRIANVFRDPHRRPVSSLVWTNETEAKLVASYCNTQFQKPGFDAINKDAYVWDIERTNDPAYTLTPKTGGIWQVACSIKDPFILAGGLSDGKVCEWDIRANSMPVATCPAHVAHRDPVSAMLYIASRTQTEFFSGSSDGQCLWWDSRNFSEPIDQMTMTLKLVPGEEPNISNAVGVTSLQYERALPTRFLCGFETGLCVNVNRKGRTLQEKMSSQWEAHSGPVRAVHRNPNIMKMFMTCGEWSVKLWSEEIRNSCIISMAPARYQITDVAWAPQRVSGFMTVCTDGLIYYWDLLRKFHEPIASLPISQCPLAKIRPHEEGKLIAVSDIEGTLSLVNLSDNMVYSGPNDKQLMGQTYDRETRREHVLETRQKEIKLKQRQEAEAAKSPLPVSTDTEAEELEMVRHADIDYKKSVEQELKRVAAAQRGLV